MSYSKEIYKLISNYLPMTSVELGEVLPITSVSISGSKLVLGLSASDYSFIIGKFSNDDNLSYTASNFRIKNKITSMTPYPDSNAFAFLVKFERIFKNDAGTDVPLKGFDDTDYNTDYRIVRKIDDYNVVLAPLDDAPIASITGDLGFYSVYYASGLNGVKTLTLEGSNSVSFPLDANSLSTLSTVDDLDLTTMPNLWFYQDNLLVMNLDTFLRNNADGTTKDYLVIDSKSVVGSPIRSKQNSSDAPYFSFNKNGYFFRQYTVDLAYILERSEDDAQNNTSSGSDIDSRQVKMFDALSSILRRPIPSDNKKVFSSITITDDATDNAILGGSVLIRLQASFTVQYMPDSVLDLSDEGVYKINQINYNSDEIIV